MALVERTWKDGKTKTFWAAIYQNGRTVFVNCGHSKVAARDLHDRLITKGREGTLPHGKDVRFSTLVERYLANGTHHLREQSITAYKSRLRNHLMPYFSEMKVRRGVSAASIGAWIAWQRHNKVSDLTIRRCLVTLSAVLSYATSINLVTENACAKVEAPPKAQDGGVDYVLSPEQVSLLIKHTPKGNDRCLMVFMFMAGARPSEICEARFGDCDWNVGTITISRTATKTGSNAPKNGASRVIPLAPSLRRAMSEQKRAMNAGSGDLCFPTIRGKRRDMQRYARDVLRPSLTRAGLRVPDGSAVNYLGRKTFISTLISQGASIKMVSDMVGSSPAQILKTYQKVRQEDATAAIDRMDAMMVGDRRGTRSEVA